jgi:hypothetical protein
VYSLASGKSPTIFMAYCQERQHRNVEAFTTDIAMENKSYLLYKRENTIRVESVCESKSSCLSRRNATIKQHIYTPAVHSLVVMAPKHVLVPHRAHSFIVDVQPRFHTATVSILVEHVDRIVTAAWGLAVVVKHPMKLIVHGLRRFPGKR